MVGLGLVCAWDEHVTEDFGAETAKNCPSGTQLFPLGSCLG